MAIWKAIRAAMVPQQKNELDTVPPLSILKRHGARNLSLKRSLGLLFASFLLWP
jgi:hypothetical protein